MLWYADDVFTIHRKWLFEYADELERRGLRVPFETITREDRLERGGGRTTLARDGLLPAVDRRRERLAAGAGRDEAADRRGARARDGARCCSGTASRSGMFIMLGYEGEETADIEATVAHLKARRPDTFLTTVAYPIKGTPYYRAGRGPRRPAARRGTKARTAT